jgi:hypothetical protein
VAQTQQAYALPPVATASHSAGASENDRARTASISIAQQIRTTTVSIALQTRTTTVSIAQYTRITILSIAQQTRTATVSIAQQSHRYDCYGQRVVDPSIARQKLSRCKEVAVFERTTFCAFKLHHTYGYLPLEPHCREIDPGLGLQLL